MPDDIETYLRGAHRPHRPENVARFTSRLANKPEANSSAELPE